tara:strand:- start:19675 stop:20016 length:342 start_codon:yes stop_codon:yes gene_type:complete
MQNDFLLSILEQQEAGRRGIFEQFGVGPNRRASERRSASSLFQPAFNQFLGQLAGEIGGGQPMSTFKDFLQGGQFNIDRELLRTPSTSFTSNQNILGQAPTQFDFGQQRVQGF